MPQLGKLENMDSLKICLINIYQNDRNKALTTYNISIFHRNKIILYYSHD